MFTFFAPSNSTVISLLNTCKVPVEDYCADTFILALAASTTFCFCMCALQFARERYCPTRPQQVNSPQFLGR